MSAGTAMAVIAGINELSYAMAENDPLSGWRTFLPQFHARNIAAIEFLGTPLRIASRHRFRAMKLATARPIDLADVAMIDEVLSMGKH